MKRRELLGAALTGGLGVGSLFGRNRPTPTTGPKAGRDRNHSATQGTTTSGSTNASQDAISTVSVGRRGLAIEFESEDSATQLSLVSGDTVVYRRRVWADQSSVSIDLYDVELTYPDRTYRNAGYRPGTYTLVAYRGHQRVDEVDIRLVHGLAIDGVTVAPVQVDGGPTVPHLVYSITNTGSGPSYVHEVHYRDARDATAAIENPDSGRDLYAETDHELHVLPAAGSRDASPPLRPFVPSRNGDADARFLAPGETRRYLGPPVGDTYHDTDDAASLSLEPESLPPSVTLECVSGNTGPQDPNASDSGHRQFAALRADHLDAVSIVAYDLQLSASDPTVTDEWGGYADVTVEALQRTATWRR